MLLTALAESLKKKGSWCGTGRSCGSGRSRITTYFSSAIKFPVLRNAPHFFVLPPSEPFPPSMTVFASPFRVPNFHAHGHGPAPRHILATLQSHSFPRLNLHRTSVCRNRRRLPSSHRIENAQPLHARACILPTCASDRALGLIGTYRRSIMCIHWIEAAPCFTARRRGLGRFGGRAIEVG